jgi:hypothetical protein
MLGQEAERGGMSVPLTDILHYTLALVLPILTGAIIGTEQQPNQLPEVAFNGGLQSFSLVYLQSYSAEQNFSVVELGQKFVFVCRKNIFQNMKIFFG